MRVVRERCSRRLRTSADSDSDSEGQTRVKPSRVKVTARSRRRCLLLYVLYPLSQPQRAIWSLHLHPPSSFCHSASDSNHLRACRRPSAATTQMARSPSRGLPPMAARHSTSLRRPFKVLLHSHGPQRTAQCLAKRTRRHRSAQYPGALPVSVRILTRTFPAQVAVPL